MSMAQPAERAAPVAPMADVWAVRVARFIRERVVFAMVGDPGDDGPLDRRRAERRQYAAQSPPGLEATVRKQAMEANRHAKARDQIGACQDREIAPVKRLVPDLPSPHHEQQEGDRGY